MTTRQETPTVPVMHAQELFQVLNANPYPGATMFMDCPYRVVLTVGGREMWNRCGVWVTSGLSLRALAGPGASAEQVHADIRRVLDVCAAADGGLSSIAKCLGLPSTASVEASIRTIEGLQHAARASYSLEQDQKRWRAMDRSALAQVFGLDPASSFEDVLAVAQKTRAEVAKLTGLAIDRGDAINRLLSILKAPLHYEGGEPLTQEERIEWALRRAPKT